MAASSGPKLLGKRLQPTTCCYSSGRRSPASHFVEFEWNTALALQKSILPCWLDQTPLPPALSAINGIDARLPHEALPKILHALQQPVTHPRAEQNAGSSRL